ncbi:MAG: hypothetical protein WBD01_04460, partial [Salaquimonas sp.]
MNKQISDLLKEVGEHLQKHSERKRLVDVTKEKIEKAKSYNEKLAKYVLEIEQDTVLDLFEEETEIEKIDLNALDFSEIVQKSLLINSIHRAGVDIKGFERFDLEQIRIANLLASMFREVSGQLRSFRA